MKKVIIAGILVLGMTAGTAAAAHADAPNPSGNSPASSTQCQAGGTDHCPPHGNAYGH